MMYRKRQTQFSGVERREKNIPVFMFQILKAVLKEQGISDDVLISGTDICAHQLDQQDSLISFDQSIKVIENALNASGETALGLLVGSREGINNLGILGYAVSCSKNGRAAVDLVNSFYKTATSFNLLELEIKGDELIHTSTPNHSVSPSIYRFLVEESLSCGARIIHDFSRFGMSPIVVKLSYSKPEHAEKYQEFFGCPIEFNANLNQAIYSGEYLNIPNPDFNLVSTKMAAELCNQMLHSLGSQRCMITKLHQYIRSHPEGFPTAQQAAKALGFSERTLRRQLNSLGTSYQHVFNDVRKTAAIQYLEDTSLSMEDIADLLGFSSGASFYRAFKKWTGKAPSAYRIYQG